MHFCYQSHCLEDTLTCARILGKYARKKDLYLLSGQLGAGKTTFVQGLAQGLGVSKKEHVISPTFVIAKEYHTGRLPLYHLDLYRIDVHKEWLTIGFDAYQEADGICVVEWGEKAEGLCAEYLSIKIEITGTHARTIFFDTDIPQYELLLKKIESDLQE